MPELKQEPLDSRCEINVGTFLTPKMAADILTVSAKTLANWRVNGFGPKFVKLGSRVAYPVPELVQFIESRICSSTSQELGGR